MQPQRRTRHGIHTVKSPVLAGRAAKHRPYTQRGLLVATLGLLVGGQFFVQKVSSAEAVAGSTRRISQESVVSNYAHLVSINYQDSLAAVTALQNAVALFVVKPSEPALEAARRAWREARVPYCQSEAFRFYDGPIDQIDGMVNAWPIDENYIDYVAENPDGGLINALAKYPVLSTEVLLSLNEQEGKKCISTGFHAIEFLLWGQDRSSNGPGQRSWRDYTDETQNAGRRRQCLQLTSKLLVEHVEGLVTAWAQGNATNYRSAFMADPKVSFAKLLKGIGALSGPEVAGERLTVPYETKEQEEEQSCFSDNTRDDIVNNAIGVRNVFFGCYSPAQGSQISGASLYEFLRQFDPGLANKLAAQVETTVIAARNIPHPFDRAILGGNASPGRMAIKAAILAFQSESDLLARAAKLQSDQFAP